MLTDYMNNVCAVLHVIRPQIMPTALGHSFVKSWDKGSKRFYFSTCIMSPEFSTFSVVFDIVNGGPVVLRE